MKRHCLRSSVLLTVLCCTALLSAVAAPAHKAMLLTGQNNHDWKMSSPILQQILEDTGLFSVDLVKSPAGGEEMSAFAPDFSAYEVIVLDYTGDSWSEATKTAFVDYVKNGGGVVVYHAADNAFPEWPEFNEIIGLGGWGNRTERHGPYLRWRDGAIVRDEKPGPGGGHGKQHDFQVVNRVTDHPITKGLPEKWMHAEDELYDKLRGPAKNITVLSTAYSDKKQNGTGEHEPILMTIAYGKGRVFHTVLGHAGGKNPPPAMQCVGFIVTFQRGAEWAATGAVTQAIPEDFPAADQVRKWDFFRPVSLKASLEAIKDYQFNQSLEHSVAIEDMLRAATGAGEDLGSLEAAFLDFLKSDASLEAKFFVCRKLSMIGTASSIPQLTAMLSAEETRYMARYALTRIPGEEATRALLNGLGAAQGEAKIGYLTSLAQRGDREAVAAILPLLRAKEDSLVIAAISALSEIGGAEAIAGLKMQLFRVSAEALLVMQDALLHNAQQLMQAGDLDAAYDLFYSMYMPQASPGVRGAALRGVILSGEKLAGGIILSVLSSPDTAMQSVAIATLRELESTEALKEVADRMADLSPLAQEQMLAAFADRAAPEVLPAVLKAADHKESGVRLAALKALADLGAGESVLFLAERAANAEGAEKAQAWESLLLIHGQAMDSAFIAGLAAPCEPVQLTLLKAMAERKISQADEAILALAASATPDVQEEALNSLAVIGDAMSMPAVIEILLNTDAPEVREASVGALVALSGRAPDQDNRAESLLAALPTISEAPARAALMTALGKIGAKAALPDLYAALKSEDEALLSAAVLGLSSWPNADPASRLLMVAKRKQKTTLGEEALMGYITLTAKVSDREAASKVRMYKRALGLATSLEAKQAICEGLGDMKKEEALDLLYTMLEASEEALVSDVLKAFAKWPNAAPLSRLMKIARDAQNDTHQVLALRASVRLIGLDKESSADEIATLYSTTMALAPNADEKKAVLSALAKTPNIGALRLADAYLDDAELHEEAEVAVAKLAETLAGSYPLESQRALKRVLAQTEFDFVKTQAEKVLAQLDKYAGYITAWEASGPYLKEGLDGKALFDLSFAPEEEGADATWAIIPAGTNKDRPFQMELDKFFGGDNRVAYIRTAIWSEKEQAARLELGSDDGVKLWLNGKVLYAKNVVRPCVPNADKIDITLKQGWNPLTLKVVQVGGQWAVCTRLRSAEGDAPLENIRIDINGK